MFSLYVQSDNPKPLNEKKKLTRASVILALLRRIFIHIMYSWYYLFLTYSLFLRVGLQPTDLFASEIKPYLTELFVPTVLLARCAIELASVRRWATSKWATCLQWEPSAPWAPFPQWTDPRRRRKYRRST